MSGFYVLVVVAIGTYAVIALLVALYGFVSYGEERHCGTRSGRCKAARQVKYAAIWPGLIPSSKAWHFIKELRRDMRRQP